MPKFSQAFGLGKSQPELDFVDVSLLRDNRLFLDPFGIAQELDRWSQNAAATVGMFFQQVIDDIRAGHEDNAKQLLLNLREPNETRLGYSANRPQGAGIGDVLAAQYPRAKEFLFEFSRQNPELLREYREDLKQMERTDTASDVDSDDETIIAEALAEVLRHTGVGNDHAAAYHRVMIGIVEFIFYPKLAHPKKELEIHEGRKRIDIVMENGAHTGIFYTIPNIRHLPCSYVPLECKNYGREVGNPELDQLAGRFSVNRGKMGFLCCREFQDRALFVQRCRDTLVDDRGLVLPLDDETILRSLDAIARGNRNGLEREWAELVNEVWLN